MHSLQVQLHPFPIHELTVRLVSTGPSRHCFRALNMQHDKYSKSRLMNDESSISGLRLDMGQPRPGLKFVSRYSVAEHGIAFLVCLVP